MGESPAESCLLLTIPEADPVIGAIRERLDENVALGVPAHVTVLSPFVPADDIDAGLTRRLARLFSQVEAFDYSFTETRWFFDDVLWLAPADDGPFRRLTDLVLSEFPAFPPYAGAFDDATPHLTISHHHPKGLLADAETEASLLLPIRGRASAVTLFAQTRPGSAFSPVEAFSFGRLRA